MDDNKFEKILRSRYVPPMRSNLEERIIQASLSNNNMPYKQQRRGNIRDIFAGIFDSLILPKPALSFAVVLVLGIALGQSSAFYGDVMLDGDDFFLVSDSYDIEYGEFL